MAGEGLNPLFVVLKAAAIFEDFQSKYTTTNTASDAPPRELPAGLASRFDLVVRIKEAIFFRPSTPTHQSLYGRELEEDPCWRAPSHDAHRGGAFQFDGDRDGRNSARAAS